MTPAMVVGLAGGAGVVFGLMTLTKGGSVLRQKPSERPAGVVPFVLRFNFIAGFFYIAAGVGAFLGRAWSFYLALALALATAAVFVAFGVHVVRGGSYMRKTFGAMTLRTTFWSAQSFVLCLYL